MLKNKKGITLIALIITIIVMLILVGVTINVALNGGLFQKAETATKETEEKAILEEMLAMMEITNDGKIDYTKIKDKMMQKYDGTTYSYPNITIPGKLGTYNYIVSETEIKIGESNAPQVDEKLKSYLLGQDGKGRQVVELDEKGNIIGGIFNGTKFVDDPDTPEDESEYGIEPANMLSIDNGKNFDVYIKYASKLYRVKMDNNYYTQPTPGIVEVYSPKGREGQTIEIGGEEWTILYDNGTNVEAVSPTVYGRLTLGVHDEEAEGSTELEIAINSYNNAITRINQFCKEQISDDIAPDSNVRSIGASSETTKYFREYDIPGYITGTDTWFKEYDNLIKAADSSYEQDYARMIYYGLLSANDTYWFASRYNIYHSASNSISFYVLDFEEDGSLYGDGYVVLNVGSSNVRGSSPIRSVRPVIKVEI